MFLPSAQISQELWHYLKAVGFIKTWSQLYNTTIGRTSRGASVFSCLVNSKWINNEFPACWHGIFLCSLSLILKTCVVVSLPPQPLENIKRTIHPYKGPRGGGVSPFAISWRAKMFSNAKNVTIHFLNYHNFALTKRVKDYLCERSSLCIFQWYFSIIFDTTTLSSEIQNVNIGEGGCSKYSSLFTFYFFFFKIGY